MFRATTPTHVFELPFEANLVKTIQITYQQEGKTILQKTEADCTITENAIRAVLTQEETLKFDAGKWVYIQLRIVTAGGQVMASQIEKRLPKACLDEEVLG